MSAELSQMKFGLEEISKNDHMATVRNIRKIKDDPRGTMNELAAIIIAGNIGLPPPLSSGYKFMLNSMEYQLVMALKEILTNLGK